MVDEKQGSRLYVPSSVAYYLTVIKKVKKLCDVLKMRHRKIWADKAHDKKKYQDNKKMSLKCKHNKYVLVYQQ